MNLEWTGQERIPASKATVWAFINDPGKVASCLPDLISSNVKDAHSVDATVKVAVGPVRGKFKFAITLEPRRRRQPHGSQDQRRRLRQRRRSARGRRSYRERDGTTTLDWKGNASVSGTVATIGGRVLDAQAHRVISTTFENVKNQLSASDPRDNVMTLPQEPLRRCYRRRAAPPVSAHLGDRAIINRRRTHGRVCRRFMFARYRAPPRSGCNPHRPCRVSSRFGPNPATTPTRMPRR